MKKEKRYKTIIFLLLAVIAAQAAFMLFRPPKEKKPEITQAKLGKIAIVIDDLGYNLNNLPIFYDIKLPLNVSVLPNLAYSKEVSMDLHKTGMQVILHLPLEPYEKIRLEQNTIEGSMDDAEIIEILHKDIDSVYKISGVSNHMGSKGTADPRVMRLILGELKKRDLYFLDSLVSSKSVCSDMAKKVELGFAKRDIFLDNEEKAEYIKQQISKLKAKARINGHAIGIGHDRKVTLEVLREVMPELDKEGYQFVYVSDLINKNPDKHR